MADSITPQLKELQTRFLYPFYFKWQAEEEAAQALSCLMVHRQPNADNSPQEPMPVWQCVRRHELEACSQPQTHTQCVQPHEFYQEEMLQHVVAFLFPKPGDRGCAYLKLSDPVANRWFSKTEVLLPRDVKIPVRLVEKVGIELFLSHYGVGVLSIALTPQTPLTLDQAKEFNYRLSQDRRKVVAYLQTPHAPKYNGQPLPAEAPLEDRVGVPGESFTLNALRDRLLSPLIAAKPTFGFEPVQNQFAIYTVARFGEDVDFENSDTRTALAPFLSALTQVEEPSHAGAPPDMLGGKHLILNRKHWASVGLLGTAHIVADQSGDVSYNSARVLRVFSKYCIAYLVALLQRLTLQRTIREAGPLIFANDPQQLADLRNHLLRFAINGYFTQISTRESIHQYYRLSQAGLDVPDTFQAARQAIADLDAEYDIERQIEVAKNTADHVSATQILQKEVMQNVKQTKIIQDRMAWYLEVMQDIQVKVEWIEVGLISVYFTHLAEMILQEAFSGPDKNFFFWRGVNWVLILVALLSATIAALFLRPWSHGKHNAGEEEHAERMDT